MSKLAVLASLLVLGIACVACGPKPRNGAGDDGGSGADAAGGGDDGGGGSGSACATSMMKAQQTPLDIFIMLDHSGSMTDSVAGGGDKWDAVKAAISSFVTQPGLTNISVGMQYFGVPPSAPPPTCNLVFGCTTSTDCGAAACGPCVASVCVGALAASTGTPDSCVAADYATADVAIAPLPGAGSAITSSMAAHSPNGDSTPTEPALEGAVDYAKSWATSHAGDAVVVVLATDGDPTGCDSAPAPATAAATGLAGTPKILTFVIGVGSSLSSLNSIAAAGGTTSAFLVDTGGNVNQQFLAAMNAIQHAALGCQYTIPVPTSGVPNYAEVNVVYTPSSGGGAQTFPFVQDAASCPASGNGWYYDNNAAPTQIILCASTCTTVEADASGEVDISLGCATVIQ